MTRSDPFSHLKAEGEKNPERPRLTDAEFEAMLTAAPKGHAYLPMLLVLAGETGRRIGSIVRLRASDIRSEDGAHVAPRERQRRPPS